MKPRNILATAAVLILPMMLLSAHLFRSMSPELTDLLPLNSKYLKDIKEASERIYGRDSLVLWIESQSPEISANLQEKLTQKLEEAKLPSITSVEAKLGPESRFFFDRMGLFLNSDDLNLIKNEINSRVEQRKIDRPNTKGPNWNGGLIGNIKELLAIKQWSKRFSGFLSRYTRFKDGWYRSRDGQVSLIILRSQNTSLRLSDALVLQKEVDSVVENVRIQNPEFKEAEIKFSGTLRHLIEDNQSLYRDIEISTAIVLLLVGLSLYFYFRSLRDIFFLISTLFFGFLLTLSIASFIFRPMNANAAFMTSIVIGNGINFGIMVLTRIRESGNIEKSLEDIRTPTLLAMLGGVIAYGSLGLTEFRGFQQFGILGVLGMGSCWLSAIILIPAFVRHFEGDHVSKWHRDKPRSLGSNAKNLMKSVFAICFLAIIAAHSFPQFKPQFETNLSNLRDRYSVTNGSIALTLKIDEIFDETLSPLILLTSSREKAALIAKNLQNPKDVDNKLAQISNVISLDQLIPPNQNEKIRELKELRNQISKIEKRFLTEKEDRLLTQITRAADLKPFSEQDLPNTVHNLFEEKTGERGRIVFLESLNLRKYEELDLMERTIQTIQKQTRDIDENALILGSTSLILAITHAVQAEAKKITGWIFVVMIALVFALYRKPKHVLWILSSWGFGLLLFSACILLSKTKLHMINFLAIPITVGIGIDYVANLFSRIKSESFESSFRAVLLCSLTTSIGYASLFSAGNQGLQSFAKIALFGEMTCILAATIWGLLFRLKN